VTGPARSLLLTLTRRLPPTDREATNIRVDSGARDKTVGCAPESQQPDDLCHPAFVVSDQHVAARA
jgi:hypothetical protein